MSEQIVDQTSENVVQNDGRWAQLQNLRTLNADHINQTMSILREATAKSFGLEAGDRALPFPGSNITNTTINKGGLSPWLALPLAALLPLGGYLAAKLLPLTNASVPAVVQPNQNPITNPAQNNVQFDPNLYQFRVVPYAPPQTDATK